jgi:hypothetical protein
VLPAEQVTDFRLARLMGSGNVIFGRSPQSYLEGSSQ